MTFACLLFVIGMALSAFFSGAETGFYRLNRTRLVISALEGGWISRWLLWAANNPSLFVATALVGNNVANYVTTAAIVLAAGSLAPAWPSAELVAPLFLAPVIFVYGELLPKNLFLAAPNRLLHRCGPALGIAAILFAPVSALLWLFNLLLETIGKKSPEQLRMVLARHELGNLLDEGEAIGLLKPTQQSLAQATIALGGQTVANFMAPASRFPPITRQTTPREAVLIAQRSQRILLPVEKVRKSKRKAIGYVRVTECLLAPEGAPLQVHPLLVVNEKQPYLATIAQMLAAGKPLARVVNQQEKTVGYVTLANLQEALLAD